MSEIKDGGPAFPLFAEYEHDSGAVVREFQFGMSLRDYFAAKALPAVIAGNFSRAFFGRDTSAQEAYEFADAMLKARE
jgi:hypothetical protein